MSVRVSFDSIFFYYSDILPLRIILPLEWRPTEQPISNITGFLMEAQTRRALNCRMCSNLLMIQDQFRIEEKTLFQDTISICNSGNIWNVRNKKLKQGEDMQSCNRAARASTKPIVYRM